MRGESRGKLKSHHNSTGSSYSVQTIFSPTLEIFTFKIYIKTRSKRTKKYYFRDKLKNIRFQNFVA